MTAVLARGERVLATPGLTHPEHVKYNMCQILVHVRVAYENGVSFTDIRGTKRMKRRENRFKALFWDCDKESSGNELRLTSYKFMASKAHRHL